MNLPPTRDPNSCIGCDAHIGGRVNQSYGPQTESDANPRSGRRRATWAAQPAMTMQATPLGRELVGPEPRHHRRAAPRAAFAR
jgi:hypothetical protein